VEELLKDDVSWLTLQLGDLFYPESPFSVLGDSTTDSEAGDGFVSFDLTTDRHTGLSKSPATDSEVVIRDMDSQDIVKASPRVLKRKRTSDQDAVLPTSKRRCLVDRDEKDDVFVGYCRLLNCAMTTVNIDSGLNSDTVDPREG
jgi:hypothetical protein